MRVEISSFVEALALVDQWEAAYAVLKRDYMALNERLIDAQLDRDVAETLLMAERAERALARLPKRPFVDEPVAA